MIKDKRVTILCQHFYPEDVGTGAVLTGLAEDLVGYGYKVSVIAGRPSRYHCINHKRTLKSCSVYKGIIIRRIYNTRFDKNTLMGRGLNALTYSAMAFLNLLMTSRKSALLAYTSPPFLPLVALLNKSIRMQPYIVVVEDVFPDTAVKLGYFNFPNFAVAILNFVFKKPYDFSERIVVIGRDIKKTIEKKGIKPDKIIYIPNWADSHVIKPLEKVDNPFIKKYALQNKFIVGYSGTLGMPHSFEALLQAAACLRGLPIVFLFISTGLRIGELKEQVRKYSLDNFLFLPLQEKDSLKHTLSAADVWMVTLKEGFGGLSVPSKLYSYMASGRPVIAVVPQDSEVAKTIEETECGFVVSPSDPKGLIEKINILFRNRELIKQMGSRSRTALEHKYSRQVITKEYSTLLNVKP